MNHETLNMRHETWNRQAVVGSTNTECSSRRLGCKGGAIYTLPCSIEGVETGPAASCWVSHSLQTAAPNATFSSSVQPFRVAPTKKKEDCNLQQILRGEREVQGVQKWGLCLHSYFSHSVTVTVAATHLVWLIWSTGSQQAAPPLLNHFQSHACLYSLA